MGVGTKMKLWQSQYLINKKFFFFLNWKKFSLDSDVYCICNFFFFFNNANPKCENTEGWSMKNKA